MKKISIFILIILLFEIPLASSYTSSEIEWGKAVEATLHKGNNFSSGPYTVIAVEFPSSVPGFKNNKNEIVPDSNVNPVVYIEIYKNGALLKEVVLSPQSPTEIDADHEFKISLTDILPGTSRDWVDVYYNPWAKISISLRGQPKFDLKITTDKTSYVSSTDEIMKAKVEVKNVGEAVARNVEVDLDPGVILLRGGSESQLHQTYLEFKKDETKTFEMTFLVPKVTVDKEHLLSVKAKGYDVKDLEYRSNGSLTVPVSPKPFKTGVSVSKSIKKMIYLRDSVAIRVTISNGGDYDIKNIRLTDSLHEDFAFKFDSPLYWEIPEIKTGQDWGVTYSLRPLETNLDGFKIPVANALFTINNKEYNASSDSPSIVVNGPKIILNKTVDKKIVNISEDVKVTVSVKNVGNIATRTKLIDHLPDGVSLVSGQTSIDSIFLEVNKPQGFSYLIRPKIAGDIELPAAVANYSNMEYMGLVRSALSSNKTMITVIDPDNINLSNTSNNISDNGSIIASGTPSNDPRSDGKIPVTLPETRLSNEDPVENSPEEPEITPTPITPFIDMAFTIFLFLFAAFYRRK